MMKNIKTIFIFLAFLTLGLAKAQGNEKQPTSTQKTNNWMVPVQDRVLKLFGGRPKNQPVSPTPSNKPKGTATPKATTMAQKLQKLKKRIMKKIGVLRKSGEKKTEGSS